jgi:hypothetical protein
MEQQQDEDIHPRILALIRRLQQEWEGVEQQDEDLLHQHRLSLTYASSVNRQSVQYFVDFLSREEEPTARHVVTELELSDFSLLQPSDGGMNVLCDFLANQMTLTTVKITHRCNFGTTEEASRLLAAFQTNRTVTDLTIYSICNREGSAALGTCLSALLQNMPQLHRLELNFYTSDGIRAMQPGLRTNRSLKILDLSCCAIDDKGLHLIVDALVGNTTIQVFSFAYTRVTSNSLDNITRLVASTRLKTIYAHGLNYDLFRDEHAVQRFTDALRRYSSLEKMTGIDALRFPVINDFLARNCAMHRATALLALQPRTGRPIASKSGLWCVVFAKLAPALGRPASIQVGGVPGYPGASAIFQILQARPAILEKQLRRPSAAAGLPKSTATGSDGGGGDKNQHHPREAPEADGRKRRRL